MRSIALGLAALLVTLSALADTPPPGTVKSNVQDGAGNPIASTVVGSNRGLSCNVNNASLAVSGTFWQTTQPVSGTVTCNAGSGTLAVNGSGFTQPVSGTVAVSGGTVTATNSANGNTGSAVPTQATMVGGTDGTNLRALSVSSAGVVNVNGSGVTQPVSAASLPLPTGAATSANQSTANTSLSTIATNTGNIPAGLTVTSSRLVVDGSGVTQPVSGTFWQATQPVSGTFWQTTQPISAASLPLPTGAATSANQTAGNTALTTINTTLGSPLQNSGGSVTANIGTTNGLALDATASNIQGSPTGGTVASKSALVGGQYNSSLPTLTTAQQAAVQLDVNGRQIVSPLTNSSIVKSQLQDNSGNAINSTSNALNVNVQNSSLAVTGTFYQATQPVSGTVTANAGTNLNTSALALDTSVNGLLVAQGSTTSGQSGPITQGAVTTSAPSYTNLKTSPLSLTTVGNLRVDGSSVTQPVSGTFWQTTQPVSGTFWQTTQPVSGTFYQATQPVSGTVTANAGTPTALTVYQAAVTIGTSAIRLTHGGSAVASTRVLLQFMLDSGSSASCYLGSSSVTSSGSTRGLPILAGQTFTFNNDAGDYWGICGTASQTFYIVEQE